MGGKLLFQSFLDILKNSVNNESLNMKQIIREKIKEIKMIWKKDPQALKRLEELAKKISKNWKSKKSALELIQEQRR
jgi:hypothetical protein